MSSIESFRRWITAALIALCLAILMSARSGAALRNYLVYVGTYTNSGSKGIYAFRFDPATGQLTSVGLAADSAEPSFLAIAPGGRFLYAVNEIANYGDGSTGAVSAFSIQPETGKLLLLNQVSSLDAGPAHITLDQTGKYVLVSNYTRGSVAVIPVLEDGRLGEASAFVQHHGSSVNPERQKGPHAHAIALSPDNRFVIVADLGLDQLLEYRFDAAKGTLGTQPQIVRTAPGAGPRHLTFDSAGKFLYVINELESTVVAYSYDATTGTLHQLQTISTLAKGLTTKNTAAEIEIHPSGKFLFASNRGDDSITVFSVDSKQGTLTLVEVDSTQGKTPRHFTIDPTGSWLLAANQDSDQIVVLHVDPATGHLTTIGQVVQVPSPACIRFVPESQITIRPKLK